MHAYMCVHCNICTIYGLQCSLLELQAITYRYVLVKLLDPLHTELVLTGGLMVSSVTPVKSCESAVNSSDWSVVSETFKNL